MALSLTGNRFVPEQRALSLLRSAERWERRFGLMGLRLGSLQRYRLARGWGVHVHPRATVGDVSFPHPTSIVIGAFSVIEDGVTVYQGVTLGATDDARRDYPVIRSGASLYAGCMVFGAVEVGAGAVVAANSVVISDVPAGATVAGSPARVVSSAPAG